MREVVGVAGSVRHSGLRMAPTPVVYEPFFQGDAPAGFALLIRSSAPPVVVAREAADLLRGLDPRLPADRITTMASLVSRSVAEPRFYAVGMATFAALAALLALIGCQAALAHRVAARRKEMGLRLALGATGPSVRGLVIRRGALLGGGGALVGVAAALPVTRVLESQLYGITASDPATFLTALTLLVAAGVLAADGPARKAAQVDPAEALREG
jgi:predicted lysophospholipase L1 biosynthesis ABC-type transport system permease subunit